MHTLDFCCCPAPFWITIKHKKWSVLQIQYHTIAHTHTIIALWNFPWKKHTQNSRTKILSESICLSVCGLFCLLLFNFICHIFQRHYLFHLRLLYVCITMGDHGFCVCVYCACALAFGFAWMKCVPAPMWNLIFNCRFHGKNELHALFMHLEVANQRIPFKFFNDMGVWVCVCAFARNNLWHCSRVVHNAHNEDDNNVQYCIENALEKCTTHFHICSALN